MSHVMVVPYPGRGHINPMLNLCRSLSSRLNEHNRTAIFTVVVTEEWLGFLNSDPEQKSIRFATIPNVLPSELNRGSDMLSFLIAVKSKMERPIEELLDRMVIPVELIVADMGVSWMFDVANRRNIPVAAFTPMPATMFSVMYHVDLLESHQHLYVDVSERGKECIDYLPGISPLTLADIPAIFHDKIGQKFKDLINDLSDVTKKVNYFLLSTIYELESETTDCLRAKIQIPIYTCGPNIPYAQIKPNPTSNEPDYIKWLDSKPPKTVLYVSLGSYLPVSGDEMGEIAAGLRESGVDFLWVARGETSNLKEMCGEKGMVVEWCEQLRVLLHSSVGGFWTHCGWNSVKESLFSGVPMLTFPIAIEQPLNSKVIVQDWKIGWKMREIDGVLKRGEIVERIRRFMDLDNVERIGMVERAKEFQEICQGSVVEGGSAYKDLDAFIREILPNQKK